MNETQVGPDLRNGDMFIGLSCGIESEVCLRFPRGITVQSTFAHLMAPFTLAFAPSGKQGYHPGPWKSARGGFGQDIRLQVHIPQTAANSFDDRMNIAFTLLFLLRLWSDPSITMPAIANMPFAEIATAAEGAASIVAIETRPRYFSLGLVDETKTIESLDWVRDNFESALQLSQESSEFRLAAAALSAGQFIDNTALIMVSLWGALELLFSPSTSELKFRVSSLIASYICPPGKSRREEQRRIAKLYDRRSAAAHGKPSHNNDDVLATFELMRKVLIRFIQEGTVPSKERFEDILFGA